MDWMKIILSIFGSTGFFALIQFLITRKDRHVNELDEIDNKVTKISREFSEYKAGQARLDILRFDDELISGNVNRSRELYRTVIEEIDIYEQYSETHPEFKNSYTGEASRHIKAKFRELYEK